MKYSLCANAVIGLFSSGALQWLWGQINSMQMILLTSLFNVNFPVKAKHTMKVLWKMLTLDFLQLEALASKVFDFRETEAFYT